MGLRYVVTGSEGQLGRCLVRSFARPSAGGASDDRLLAAFAHRELDIADPAAVSRAFGELEQLDGGPPDVVVNAAAYNAVDRCESEGREQAERVNTAGPGLLAAACERIGARLVHVSTDYVLVGVDATPLVETAEPAPTGAYGRSKLGGETRVREESREALIVRTSWLFGPGKNFVGAILRQVRLRREGRVEGPLRVVCDQFGCPTYAADLAGGIRALAAATRSRAGQGGVYHLSNSLPHDQPPGEATSWWDFARAILDRQGHADLEIVRARTEELDLAAPRPRYSLLECGRAAALGVKMRTWPEALDDYLASPDLELTLKLTDAEYGSGRPQGSR